MDDKHLICEQCGGEFVFSEQEQERHARKGFDPPRRCPDCRRKRTKLDGSGSWEPRRRRQQHAWEHDER
ncbi:MAG: zinc-ribbon domain containing protein [Thermodesulfobacteriota bacterium]